ncbi:lipocalin-like domain-containing protein [Streptomyces xiamenensis]
MTSPRDLIGVWRLAALHDHDETGAVREHPLGPEPDGLLIYTADGHLSVSMMRTTPGPGPVFLGYAGRWSVADGRVTHRIDVASRADWAGTAQQREIRLRGGTLTLDVTRTIAGRTRRRAASWRRATPAAGPGRAI